MRLTAIRVRDAGPFRDGVALEGLSGGLDVLSAPNEAGKSTLFRAVETVFYKKFASTATDVRGQMSDPGGAMTIEADFEVGGSRWRVTKRFGRKPVARLTAIDGSGASLTGETAEAKLAQLIGTSESDARPHGFLWVCQRGAIDEKSLAPDALARATLSQLIAREVATLTGGRRLQQLRDSVNAEWMTNATPKENKPKGPRLEAMKRRDAAEAALKAALDAMAADDRRRAEQAELSKQKARLQAPVDAADDTATESIAAARTALGAAEAAVTSAGEAGRRHKDATRNRDDAERAAAVVETALALDAELARYEADASASQSTTTERQQAATAANLRLAAHDREIAKLEAVLRADARAELGLRLARARDAETTVEQVARDLAADRMTAERYEAIVAAERRRERAHDALAAANPKVTISYAPGGDGRIRLAGVQLPTGVVEPRQTWPMVLDIEGIGQIAIDSPAASGRDGIEADLRAAADDLDRLLRTVGLQTVTAAEDAMQRRRTLERSLDEARTSLAVIAPAGVRELEQELAALAATIAQAGPSDGIGDAGANHRPERRRPAIEAELAQLRRDRAPLAAALEAARGQASEAERAVAALSARRDAARARREATGIGIDGPAMLEARRAALSAAIREEVALRDAVPSPDDIAALNDRRERLARRCAELDRRHREIENRLHELSGERNAAPTLATPAEIERLTGERDACEAAVRAVEAETAGLALLVAELDRAIGEGFDRMLEPVMRRIEPYLEQVFGPSGLVLDKQFNVTALKRNGRELSAATLSGGTAEQIGILVRLAYARVLADNGHPVPVILDDALVYTDDERLGAMFSCLARAAGHHQVLVLTCQASRFSQLRGTRIRMCDWRDEPVQLMA